MSLGFKGTLRNSRADDTRDLVDASGAGILLIYGGVRPITGGAPPGAALVSFTLPTPVAANAVSGVSTWNAIGPQNIAISGGASWFRVEDNIGGFVFDGGVGVTGSGADMELDSVTFTSGRLISIDNFSITEGNA